MQLNKFLYESFYRPQRIIANIFNTPAVILIYHRVTTPETDPQLLAVSPENFYAQVKFLKENYNLVHPDEFTSLLSGNKFPAKTVILTFDDGYADNCIEALPILESLSESALFYVSTGLLNTKKETWWDQLERIFLLNKNLPSSLSLDIANNSFNFDISDSAKLNSVYNSLHRLIKYSKPDTRKKVIGYLNDWSVTTDEGRESHRIMTSGELVRMSNSASAVIGAHTHTHTPLSVLTFEEQKSDIEQSVNIIEEITGRQIKHFSYPFGTKKDYNSDSISLSKMFNFDFVCANYYSQVHTWNNKYELPRILVRNWDIKTFSKFIKKAFWY